MMRFPMPIGAESKLVDGPVPNEYGAVEFLVEVGEHRVKVSASPLGVGVSANESLDAGNLASVAVNRYVDANRSRMKELYREAAKLRRTAGNRPLVGNTRCDRIRVTSEPQARRNGIVVATQAGIAKVNVFLFNDGGLIDDCDDWSQVTDEDRDAAITAALDWVFNHRMKAVALGLDVDLLEELWR
jgi:hypothetical protein